MVAGGAGRGALSVCYTSVTGENSPSCTFGICVFYAQFSCSVVSNSLQLQHTRLPVHHQLPEPTQTHVH